MQAYFVDSIKAETVGRLLNWGSGQRQWLWLYGERMTGFTLAYLADYLAGELEPQDAPSPGWRQWSHGRVFGQNSELAWWQTGSDYHLRLLAETDQLPPDIEWGKGEAWQAWGTTNNTLLHGTLDTKRSAESARPSWSEGRIPQYLFYPVEIELDNVQEDDVVQTVLETQPYAQGGIVGLTRLVLVRWER